MSLCTRTLLVCLFPFALISCSDGDDNDGGPVAPTYTLGGTLSGLTGTVVLRNAGNGAELTLTANGGFVFARRLADGAGYEVVVKTQPADQTCTVNLGAGEVNGGNVSSVLVNCTVNAGAGAHTVGGTIGGLVGSVTLRNNGTDNLTRGSNGSFTFPSAINTGGHYSVTVHTQPVGQTCSVGSGSGTATADVTSVTVNCVSNVYTISGSASGLAGAVTLQNNLGDDLTLLADGSFTFATPVTHGNPYSVTVLAKPDGNTCTVFNAGGTATGHVANVVVQCAPSTWSIGGTVTNLAGSIALQNNLGNTLLVTRDAEEDIDDPTPDDPVTVNNFAFSNRVSHNGQYNVSILAAPAGQACSITAGGSGTATADVTDVAIACSTLSYTIGGTATGISGSLVVQNNGGDDLVIDAAGNFTFAIPVLHNHDFDVTILTQPVDRVCSVIRGKGTVFANNVTNIGLECIDHAPAAPTLLLGTAARPQELVLAWNPVVGASWYRLYKSTDNGSNYSQIGGDIADTRYAETVSVHLQGWTTALYRLEACNAFGCSTSPAITTSLRMLQAIGYFKAGNSDAADAFGTATALSADGRTLAVGAPCESSGSSLPSDNSVGCAGAVYIFRRDDDRNWSQTAYVKASNPDNNDLFGRAIALSADGNTLAVGALGEASNATGIDGDQTDDSLLFAGAVYVFARSGDTWPQQAYLKASNTEAQDFFGGALALSADGDTLAVGAAGEGSSATGIDGDQTDNAALFAGAVYVFTRSSTVWSQQAYIKAGSTSEQDLFGAALALSGDGDTLAVGSFGDDSAATGIDGDPADNVAGAGSGAVWMYGRSSGTWSPQAYIKAASTDSNDQFGTAVALSADGTRLAVGSPGEDSDATGIGGDATDNDASSAGAAYLFVRNAGVWSQQTYLKASNTGSGDQFGTTIALGSNGDVLAVGALNETGGGKGIGNTDDQENNSTTGAGAVYVFTDSGTAWTQRSYVKALNTEANDQFSRSLALSADGSVLAVGADGEDSSADGVFNGGTQANNSQGNAGALYLY
ncbi:MAG: beta strand repeat-containing protein [Pseudomonadota bacterium]